MRTIGTGNEHRTGSRNARAVDEPALGKIAKASIDSNLRNRPVEHLRERRAAIRAERHHFARTNTHQALLDARELRTIRLGAFQPLKRQAAAIEGKAHAGNGAQRVLKGCKRLREKRGEAAARENDAPRACMAPVLKQVVRLLEGSQLRRKGRQAHRLLSPFPIVARNRILQAEAPLQHHSHPNHRRADA